MKEFPYSLLDRKKRELKKSGRVLYPQNNPTKEQKKDRSSVHPTRSTPAKRCIASRSTGNKNDLDFCLLIWQLLTPYLSVSSITFLCLVNRKKKLLSFLIT